MMKKIIGLFLIFIFSFTLYRAEAEETLSWQDCIVEAKKNNPELIVAIETINEQKANKSIVASALYPQIDANLDVSDARNSGVSTKSYSYGVDGTQLVFDGLKTVNEVHSASEEIKAAQEDYRFTSSDVRFGLRSAFINLLRAQELVRVTAEIIKIRRDNLVLITLRYQSGLEHKGALLDAEANLASAEHDLAQAKREIDSAQRELTKQMGRVDFKPMHVKGDFAVHDTAKDRPSFEDIAKNHPLVLEASANKNSAAFNLKSTYGNFFPVFTGSAGAGKLSNTWPPNNNQWSLGLGVNMPIFEGGLRLAQVNQAKALYNQSDATERNTREAAIVTLQQTWAALQDTIENVDVRAKALAASEERSKIADAQYSIGFVTFDNWIIIENNLVSAKLAYLDAQASALLAEANWIKAKGETLEHA